MNPNPIYVVGHKNTDTDSICAAIAYAEMLRAQAIEGLEEAEIVGIIDHHRLADIQTAQPIFMRVEPVGCTCTILRELYAAAEVAVPPPIAGLLLGAILADTVLFRSPTGTPRDRQAAEAPGEGGRRGHRHLRPGVAGRGERSGGKIG